MTSNVETTVSRFIKAMKDGSDVRKLRSILTAIPKVDFMSWTDPNNQDVLHYAIMFDNAEAADFLLKMGYFAAPYDPKVNMYAHLAARLGFRRVLCIILHYRPNDFKEAIKPVITPSVFFIPSHGSVNRKASKDPLGMPSVVGSQVFCGTTSPNTSSSTVTMTLKHARFSQPSAQSQGLMKRHSSQLQPSSTELSLLGEACGVNYDKLPPGFPLSSLLDRGREEFQHGRASTTGYPFAMKRKSIPRRFSSPEDSVLLTAGRLKRESNAKPILEGTPLEIAACFKHVDCVKALLDMYVLQAHPEKGSKGYLTLAALANSKSSLRLLLEPYSRGTKDPHVREDYRTAVQICVENICPECLEVLMSTELVDSKAVFQQINLFHVMYSQPFNSYLKIVSLPKLPVMTGNLLARGHSVTTNNPPRTYPLYTLIDNAFTCTDLYFSEYIITTMKLLLDNGADPNFDEVEYEQRLSSSLGNRHYGGRHAFSSAMHCVLQSVDRNHSSYPSMGPAIRFVEDCLDALISFGADIEKIGVIDAYNTHGDVLWQFASSSASMGLERGLFNHLTRHGAQPQRRINGQYALNVYLDSLCALMETACRREAMSRWERDLKQMVGLMCSFMAPWHITAVTKIFNYHHKNSGEAFKGKVKEALEEQSKQIHTLRKIAAWQVWKLCKRKANNVQKLPVAKDLKMNVLPLILFHSMW